MLLPHLVHLEILVSLSLQDRLRRGIIIGQQTSQPASHLTANLEKWNISAATGQILLQNLSSETKPTLTNASNEDYLQWKTTFKGRRPSMEEDFEWKTNSKYPKLNNSATTDLTFKHIRIQMTISDGTQSKECKFRSQRGK